MKGETSGNLAGRHRDPLRLRRGLPARARETSTGRRCHTGERSCFYRTLCGPFAVEDGVHVTFDPNLVESERRRAEEVRGE